MSRFNANLDYIYFFCGAAFFVLSAVCLYLRKEKPAALAWRWLGYFALVAGVNKWLSLAAFTFADSLLFAGLRLAVMAVSFGLLFEFARRSQRGGGGAAPGAPVYILFAAAALLGGFYGFGGINAAVRYALGLSSGLFAGWVVVRAARSLPGQLRRPLLALGALLALYALTAGGITPESGVQPSSWLNYGTFWDIFGFPVQLLEGVIAALMAVVAWQLASAVWLYSRSLTGAEPEAGGVPALLTGWLPLATIGVVLAAGWLGTAELGRAERLSVVRDGRNNTSILYFRMNEKLQGIGQAASVMAESAAMVQALNTKGAGDLEKANVLLDRFQKVHEVDVCYLLDARGVVLASSNRKDALSFVGDNYAFRPYFKTALQGKASRYFALGNTTQARGYYAGAPVTDHTGRVLGVVTIKKNLDFLEEEMRLAPYAFFVSPEGVVFLSGRKEFLFTSLWTVDAAARYALLQSNQFGPLDFAPLWKTAPADGSLVYINGGEFYLSRLMFGSDGWSLVSLTPTEGVLVTRFYGIFITLVLCLLAVGLVVIFAQHETRRAEALELLRMREERRLLAGLLPVCAACGKARDDKEYRARLDAYLSKHKKISSTHDLCPDCEQKRGHIA
ncbi:MAG TPA: hypothetical protein PKI19_03930 [Elusimicrobiales bacterium]|nr:hypothetical protein [Elusimicrobiales bacterium]